MQEVEKRGGEWELYALVFPDNWSYWFINAETLSSPANNIMQDYYGNLSGASL